MASRVSRLILLKSTASSQPRFSSTATATATATAAATAVTQDKPETSLFHKLSQLACRNGPHTNIAETMNEWVNTGKPIKRFDIVNCVNVLRGRKSYHLALQLSRWMEGSNMGLNNADRAKHLDLLAKTEGIDSAEKYFGTLQESAKTNKTYGALLSCYCREKNLDKALELFEKMKELGFTSTLNYNNVISLYSSTDQPQKVPSLVQEMEEKNVAPDLHTYNQLIKSYGAMKDIDAIEGVLKKLKTKKIRCDWFTYGNMATIYINAGCLDKANAVLKKMENLKNLRDQEAFHTLITLYTRTSDLSGINRAWESLKSAFPTPSNTSYLIMLLALFKLGESESLEKLFKEWEAGCVNYDVRLSNVMLESYLNRNMIEEANLLYDSLVKRGREPNLRTLDVMTNFHIRNGQIDLALKYLEMGASKVILEKHKWFPTDETINMFLKYFEGKNDVERAETFVNNMKEIGRLDSAVYDSLLCRNASMA